MVVDLDLGARLEGREQDPLVALEVEAQRLEVDALAESVPDQGYGRLGNREQLVLRK